MIFICSLPLTVLSNASQQLDLPQRDATAQRVSS
jgi:hypothetical protein